MRIPLQEELRCTIRNAPRLMKLVKEFYRAYRALAKRYDFATSELCHAKQTLQAAHSWNKRYLSFSSLQTKHYNCGFFIMIIFLQLMRYTSSIQDITSIS